MALAPITILTLLLISQPPQTLSQAPTLAGCTPRLLTLTPCAPFVQGLAQSPPPSCCDNLNQLYLNQPGCLCLLLNSSNLTSFPINRTLALQLPPLCHIQLTTSTCPGVPVPQPPISSPTPQVSLGSSSNSSIGSHNETSNSTVAASPMVQVAPRPVTMGLGLSHSGGIKLDGARGFFMLLLSLSILISLVRS